MFHRRGPQPPPRISIRDESPDQELARLVRMVRDLNEVIEMLWLEVEGLRAQLAAVRNGPVSASYAEPPTQRIDIAGDGAVSLSLLRTGVDDANVAADALWFESQWLRSQLAVALEGPR